MGFEQAAARVADAVARAFGRDVQYAPQGAGAATLRAVFEAAHREVTAGGVEVADLGPALTVDLARFAAAFPGLEPAEGDGVTVDGASYVVREPPQPDGHGLALLLLSEA